ncbi:nucleotidyltransferase domain-containing protein [Lysinibacillus louembei]|uniref:Nucleotidyltransferase domain-containing protein n=1 Tax=Lysinibacillus louembei TaxID=1470088 RepID=A0ABZ0RXI1_9BACI|nr:nucleotidyltransferase domain-containing protein [Lysinibacillus louembei]WPK12119.1 nucleotidyltransferase domain-containing protein [Lysinibacillus louembei]
MAVKSVSLASTYSGSSSSRKSTTNTVKSTSSSVSAAKATTSKAATPAKPVSTHNAAAPAKTTSASSSASTAKPASTHNATVKATSSQSAAKTASTIKSASTVKPVSTHNTTATAKVTSSQNASSTAKSSSNAIYQNSGKSLTSYPMSTNDTPSKTKVTTSNQVLNAAKLVSTVKATSSQSASSTAKSSSNANYQNSGKSLTSYPMSTSDASSKAKTTSVVKTLSGSSSNVPKPLHTHSSISATKPISNAIYQNSGKSLTSYPMSTNDAPSKAKITSSVEAKAKTLKAPQETSKGISNIYNAINTKEPTPISKEMSLAEKITTNLRNSGLVLAQKGKGKVDAFADTAVDTVKSTWGLVSNPKAALDNLATAITHPKETVEAISKSAKKTVEKDYIQGNAYSRSYVEGKVLFGVGATIVGTKGLGSLTKVPDVPNIKASKLEKTPVVKNETQVDGVKGTGKGLKIPQGLTQEQFQKISQMVKEEVGHISDDIVVQGSRAKGTAKPTSDLDIAVRVPAQKFDELVQNSFSKITPPNPGSAKEKTMLHAIETGKIQSGEAKLSKFRKQLEKELGMDVDISIIKMDGPFDNPPFTPIK